MGEEFYAIIKLVSGEELFALISVDDTNEDNPIIIMQNPVTIKMLTNGPGHFIKIKPWIELSEEDIHLITLDKIITMTESSDEKLIHIYNNFISESNKPGELVMSDINQGCVRPDSKMGYVSSVKDARKTLEDIFKLKYKKI